MGKNDRNEINSCGGPSRLTMNLREHFIRTSGIAAVDSGFIFQDDNARPHRTRIVENFTERKVVMTTHINGKHSDRSALCLYTLTGWGVMSCVCGMVYSSVAAHWSKFHCYKKAPS